MKGSVWLYIHSVYTRDKRTITESQRSLIFTAVLNERNSGFTFRGEEKKKKGSRAAVEAARSNHPHLLQSGQEEARSGGGAAPVSRGH